MDFTAITESRYYRRHIRKLFRPGKQRRSWYKPLWVLTICTIVLLGLTGSVSKTTGSLVTLLVIALSVPGIALYIWYVQNSRNEIIAVLNPFLQRNALHGHYLNQEKSPHSTISPTLITSSSGNPTLPYQNILRYDCTEHIWGALSGVNFSHDLFTITSGIQNPKTGKRKFSDMSYVVLLTLYVAGPLPRLYVASRKRKVRPKQYQLTEAITEREYHLEGNFSADFQVYAESQQGVEVFATLSPEVLGPIRDHYPCDIWFDRKTVTLIIPLAHHSDFITAIPHIFPLAEALVQNIDVIQRVNRSLPDK